MAHISIQRSIYVPLVHTQGNWVLFFFSSFKLELINYSVLFTDWQLETKYGFGWWDWSRVLKLRLVIKIIVDPSIYRGIQKWNSHERLAIRKTTKLSDGTAREGVELNRRIRNNSSSLDFPLPSAFTPIHLLFVLQFSSISIELQFYLREKCTHRCCKCNKIFFFFIIDIRNWTELKFYFDSLFIETFFYKLFLVVLMLFGWGIYYRCKWHQGVIFWQSARNWMNSK